MAVRDLTVQYGRGAPVLEYVDLDIEPGSVVALLGSNGAGKTTILRSIAGSLRNHGGTVVSGSVELDGAVVKDGSAAAAVRRGIGQVLEGRRIFAGLSVEENLRTGAYSRRDKHAVKHDIQRMYDLFPVLFQRRSDAAGLLSGGEQQMLAMGRALMASPRLLLLDEPSLGLAPKVVSQVGDVIRSLRTEGLSVLLVEQNALMALSVADEGYILETGRVMRHEPAAAMLGDSSILQHYLGGDSPRIEVSTPAGDPDQTPAVQVRDLSLSFGGVHAIRGLSLDVSRGELVALIGPNGSGKTSSLNCISGLYHPDKGSIQIHGQEVRGRRPDELVRLGAARTLQHLAVIRDLSVEDNLKLGSHAAFGYGTVAAAFRTPTWFRRERAIRAVLDQNVDRFGLEAYRKSIVGTLPYGVQKRVDLARAMMSNPSLLILDEPAAGLDGEETLAMRDIIAGLREDSDLSVLLVEHDMGMVMSLANRVVVLDFGTCIAEGSPSAIRKDPAVIAAYLGEPAHASAS